MPINNRSSWMGFILALAAIGTVTEVSQALESPGQSSLSIRLQNLNTALQQRASELPQQGKTATPNIPSDLQAGFANRGGGGGGFGNARRGGFANGGGGGGFANVGRGGWADGGGGGTFANLNRGGGWGDGGGFANRSGGGGGFVNRW